MWKAASKGRSMAVRMAGKVGTALAADLALSAPRAMNGPIEATYYGTDASKPFNALVQWASADVLEVRLPANRRAAWT